MRMNIIEVCDKVNAETLCISTVWCAVGVNLEEWLHLYVPHGVDLVEGGSTCMFPRELIWEEVAPPVCSPASWSGRRWLLLYVPQGVDLGEGGSHLIKEWTRSCTSEYCKALLIRCKICGEALHKIRNTDRQYAVIFVWITVCRICGIK